MTLNPRAYRRALEDFLEPSPSLGWEKLAFFHDGSAERVMDKVADRATDGARILPEPQNIFNALTFAPPSRVRVAILGQDPYPTPGHAHGLAFSYIGGGPLPASLRNIFKELGADLQQPIRTNGDLSDWAQQDMLLLNTALTVEAGKAGAHLKFGWASLTREAVAAVSAQSSTCVFILWGDKARVYRDLINAKQHLIIESAHPSPLSARNGFFGSKPFSRANAWLAARGRTPISW